MSSSKKWLTKDGKTGYIPPSLDGDHKSNLEYQNS